MPTTRVRTDQVVGTFGWPEGKTQFPAVLALGGSDGGTPDYFLNLLVPEGFACLALQYWGTSETQRALADIPLERIEHGLHWLAGRAGVTTADGRLGVVGASRGGELALLSASTFPRLVGPVVAYTPSSVVWEGLDFAQPGTAHSTWTFEGKPLPCVKFPQDVMAASSPRGFSMLPICERGLDNQPAVDRAAIPVERATGPLLLVSGGDDRVWSAGRMSEMVVDRMKRHGRASDVRHLHYPDAGHMLFTYTLPADGLAPPIPMDLGGTPEADAAAHQDAWPQVISHLRPST